MRKKRSVAYTVEMLAEDLCRGLLAADNPLKKLENPVLREVLQSNLAIKLLPLQAEAFSQLL